MSTRGLLFHGVSTIKIQDKSVGLVESGHRHHHHHHHLMEMEIVLVMI